MTKQIQDITSKKEEEEKALKEYENNINSLESECRIKESRLKFLIETEKDKEGFSKSVKALLLACDKIPELGKCSRRST